MTQTSDLRPIPFIDLVGDIEENYYQLGLKDAEAAKLSLRHTEALIKTPWHNLDQGLRVISQSLLFNQSKWKNRFSPWLKAYAEGLGQSPERLMLALLVPELTACLSKWLPRLPKSLLGCSSLFMLNDEDQLTHIRTLDFPLGTTFDIHERIVRTQFKDQPIITSYSSAGFPYPSLTAQTSAGISFALHQKFNDVFNPDGTPIFELIQDMLIRCDDLKTTLGFLRKSKSLTTWSFHMGFKDGQVLEADLSGDQLQYNVYQLSEHEYLYFNNDLIKPSAHQANITPLNLKNYNQWRRESAHRKLNKISKKKQSIPQILKTWTTLENRKKMSLDVLTPSSLHVAAMLPHRGEIHCVMGDAPKTWQGQIQSHIGLWNTAGARPHINGKYQTLGNLDRVWHHLMSAQTAHDLGDVHHLHHYLQMAIRRSRDHGINATIELFHHIFTFLTEKHPRVLGQMVKDIIELTPKLDRSMRDHAYLMLARLERVLKLKPTIFPAQINHPRLARLLEVENAIPDAIFGTVIRSSIHPRIDLMDVIYVHEQLNP